jgi:hypothetical protein
MSTLDTLDFTLFESESEREEREAAEADFAAAHDAWMEDTFDPDFMRVA